MKESSQELAGPNAKEKRAMDIAADPRKMNMKEAKKELSSAQRLHDAEQKVLKMQGEMSQVLSVLRELVLKMGEFQQQSTTSGNAMSELGKRVDSIIAVLDTKSVASRDSINQEMVNIKIKDLTSKVENLKTKDVIRLTDSVVRETSFLVVEERNTAGELVSPRTQFILATLSEDNRNALLGKKSGEQVSLGEGKNNLTLLEVYDIVEKQEEPEGTLSDEEIKALESEESSESNIE